MSPGKVCHDMPKSPRILCVDDNDDTCFLLKTLLGTSDLEAVTAPNTKEALRLIEKEQFDLFIVDLELPDGLGLDLCREIRKRNRKTPIVIYSGAAYPIDRAEGRRAGANAYLVKPDVSEIVPTIKRLLDER